MSHNYLTKHTYSTFFEKYICFLLVPYPDTVAISNVTQNWFVLLVNSLTPSSSSLLDHNYHAF